MLQAGYAVVAICPLRKDDNVVEAIEGMYVQARPG
jgi:hypothetical protein